MGYQGELGAGRSTDEVSATLFLSLTVALSRCSGHFHRRAAVLDCSKVEPCLGRAKDEDRSKPTGSALSFLPSI